MKLLTIHSPDDLDQAAEEFLTMAGGHRIIAFEGQLGSGKTTFIKALCNQLGCIDPVSSPTFAIVNEYRAENNTGDSSAIYHMDLYRLKDLNEAVQAGIEEYLSGEHYCFIEWPEIIRPLLPEDTLFTKIEVDPKKNSRKISIFS